MQERLLQKNLKVQDKTTLAMRMNRRVAKLFDTRDSEEEGAADGVDEQAFTLEITRGQLDITVWLHAMATLHVIIILLLVAMSMVICICNAKCQKVFSGKNLL